MVQAARAELMRRINRSAVLNLIRHSAQLSRPEIARQLNMSLPTVMKVVEGLIAEGLVHPCGYGKSTGGRPAELLEFGGTQHAIIGIDLGGSKMFGAVADLLGHIQYEVYVEHAENELKDPLERLYSLISALLAAPRPATQQVWGIGIGVPSITLRPEGIVVNAPSLGWRDFPLQQILSERFGLRILVENDVNLACLGEWEFGVGGNSESMVYITIGTGIGAGVLLNGQIHRGFNFAAGEIGHFVPSPRFLGQRYEGFGALEHVASGLSIQKRTAEVAERLKIPSPAGGWGAEPLFAAANDGQAWAAELVDEIADYLAVAVAGVSVVLNPELIVFSGGVMKSGRLLVTRVQRRLQGAIPFVPRIELSEIGYRAAALGAIALLSEMSTAPVKVTHAV
ncbi:MAG: ROK family protein [Anaerolineae bacterium]|nr:ROK family protein [Anaerolineae bacterium]